MNATLLCVRVMCNAWHVRTFSQTPLLAVNGPPLPFGAPGGAASSPTGRQRGAAPVARAAAQPRSRDAAARSRSHPRPLQVRPAAYRPDPHHRRQGCGARVIHRLCLPPEARRAILLTTPQRPQPRSKPRRSGQSTESQNTSFHLRLVDVSLARGSRSRGARLTSPKSATAASDTISATPLRVLS